MLKPENMRANLAGIESERFSVDDIAAITRRMSILGTWR